METAEKMYQSTADRTNNISTTVVNTAYQTNRPSINVRQKCILTKLPAAKLPFKVFRFFISQRSETSRSDRAVDGTIDVSGFDSRSHQRETFLPYTTSRRYLGVIHAFCLLIRRVSFFGGIAVGCEADHSHKFTV
jgi:hypothetical protein